jgi:hypothetical protein
MSQTGIRFRSRHLHATLVQLARTELNTRGWITAPINFGTGPTTVIDYSPDERGQVISSNTVAISLGDFAGDDDEELGAAVGGLRSALYRVYVDIYMAEQALTQAMSDDVRDIFADQQFDLIDQITGAAVPATRIEIERIEGPDRPSNLIGAEQFKRFWRTMRVDARLYFLTS